MKTGLMWFTTAAWCVLACIFAGLASGAAPRPGIDYTQAVDRLGKAVRAEMDRHGIGAISVAMVDEQRVLCVTGFGTARPDTVFRAGSISKLFNAVAIMQLVFVQRSGYVDFHHKMHPVGNLGINRHTDRGRDAEQVAGEAHYLEQVLGCSRLLGGFEYVGGEIAFDLADRHWKRLKGSAKMGGCEDRSVFGPRFTCSYSTRDCGQAASKCAIDFGVRTTCPRFLFFFPFCFCGRRDRREGKKRKKAVTSHAHSKGSHWIPALAAGGRLDVTLGRRFEKPSVELRLDSGLSAVVGWTSGSQPIVVGP